MLYVCVPTYNEAVTVGVLLWRVRTVLGAAAGGRDYEVLVYDDASTDATAEVLAPYARVLPLTVVRGAARVGETAAVAALMRVALERSRAPEGDAVVVLQADYTDDPALLPALLGAFDGGADLVLTRRPPAPDQPFAERRVRRLAGLLAPLARRAVSDRTAADPAALLSAARLFRLRVLADATRAAGGAPLASALGWPGRAELVVRAAPFARSVARVDAPARYDVRTRPSRVDWARELRAVTAFLWRARGAARGGPPVEPTGGPARVAGPAVLPAPAPAPPFEPAPAPSAEASPAPEHPGEAGAEPGPRRRRRSRRGRGGSALGDTPALALVDSPTQAPPAAEVRRVDAPRADTPPNDAPTNDAPANDASSDEAISGEAPAGNAPAAAGKRRRRRGGARRGARGRAGDTGVGPADPDGDAADHAAPGGPWQDAPVDQPPL